MKTLLALLLTATIASAQSCPQRIELKPAPITSRGEKIIYKSNWNVMEGRENTIEEGNHSQKGAALLVHYKAKRLLPTNHSIEVRDIRCKLIGKMGRFPRCTQTGCGEYERWYLRAPGSSYLSVQALADRAEGGAVLIRLKGRQWAVVSNVYSDRESAR